MTETTRVHRVPAGTMANALLAAGIVSESRLAFDYDLVAKTRAIANNTLASSVLMKLVYSCDGKISTAIRSALTKLRVEREAMNNADWDNYAAFLSYAEGLATNEEVMREAGMEVQPLVETVQQLYWLREHLLDIIEERFQLGSVEWERPQVTDLMLKPRVRTDDSDTIAKNEQWLRDEATDNDGVIDVAKLEELREALTDKDKLQKLDELRWEKRRGQVHAMFFDALPIAGLTAEVVEDEAFDPFGDLPAQTQLSLMQAAERFILGEIDFMRRDRRITASEFASAKVEANGFLRELRLAMEHDKFTEQKAAPANARPDVPLRMIRTHRKEGSNPAVVMPHGVYARAG